MTSSPSRRVLRSSNRLSLSLSGRKAKKREKVTENEVQSSDSRRNCEATPVDATADVPLIVTELARVERAHMDIEPHNNSSIRAELRSPETIVILSDDENDMRSPLKKSISEYFTPSKEPKQTSSKTSAWTTGRKRCATVTSSVEKAVPKTAPKRVGTKVRRKICPTTNIKMLTKKYFDDSQKRITNFFNKEDDPDRIGYCRVLKESAMPTIVTGDLDVENMLSIMVEEGRDTLSFLENEREPTIPTPSQDGAEISPTSIMERIERVQSACYDSVREDWNMERMQMPIATGTLSNDETTGDSGILLDAKAASSNDKSVQMRGTPVGRATQCKRARKAGGTTKGEGIQRKAKRKMVCPPYKIIAGTNFAVDAFRYGDIAGVTHYVLTHFHADHYIGLKKSFSKPLIMSPITARLVKTFINVSEQHYQLIELHQRIVIDGVEIIALDANHCPGAIMFLFCLPGGTNILHTGDFRASPEMEEYPEFWNMSIDSIYLDTTYLSSKYAFKSQWESVADARTVVSAYLKKHIGTKVLIVCGSYLIGKEKVWLELATSSKMKVWTEPNRWKALKAVADPNQLSVIVPNPTEANIHVLAMKKLSYDELNEYMSQFADQYDSVIAIRPSGWEKNSKPQYRGRINIVGIEYSEHSSFDELKRFVQFIRPREVVSTVPYGNSNQNRTPSVPSAWFQAEVRPHRKALQLSITNFIATSMGNDSTMNRLLSSISERKPKVEEKLTANRRETKVEDMIDLGSEVSEKNERRSEASSYNCDSDWLP